MKTTFTELAALAVAVSLFSTGPALTFSPKQSHSPQIRLQAAQQAVRKAVKPKAVTVGKIKKTASSKKKKQDVSTTTQTLAKTVTKSKSKQATVTRTQNRNEIATIPDQTLKSRKRTIPSHAAEANAKAKKAAQQKLDAQSKVAEGGPQPEPPTVQKRKLLPPRLDRPAKTGRGRYEDFGDFREAADAMRDLRHLQDAVNRDQWGREGGGAWPGNGHGTPGDDFKSRPGGDLPDHLPSGAKQLETEGAPDQAAYFNEPMSRPGGSGGQAAPDDGGPQRGYWRPSQDGASGPLGPGDVPDPRGVASDGGSTAGHSWWDNGIHRTTTVSPDGTITNTYYDPNPSSGERSSTIFEAERENGTGMYIEKTVHNDGSSSIVGYIEHDDGTTTYLNLKYDSEGNRVDSEFRVGPTPSPGTPDSQPGGEASPQESREAEAYLCATMPYLCRPGHQSTPDEMRGQPGREGAGGGGGGRPRLGEEAVINPVDGYSYVPPPPSAGGHGNPSAPPGLECINCGHE